MKITRQYDNPAAYRSTVAGVEFLIIFKNGKNTINGHPTRRAFVVWDDLRGFGLCCRELSIILYYESEQEAADQIARHILESWKK